MADRLIKKKKYCAKCGNSGTIPATGERCSCMFNTESFFESVNCLDVPEQYRGVCFTKALLPADMHESYGDFLDKTFTTISNGEWTQHNLLIASPVAHGKTIFAYSCLEVLCRVGMVTFPLYDVLELKRIIGDIDMGRKQTYEVEEPDRIFTTSILFVRVPRVRSLDMYDAMSMILDRRVRRGLSTIFLYNGAWADLVEFDKFGIISGLKGDGTYGTLEVKSWYAVGKVPHPDIYIEENKG